MKWAKLGLFALLLAALVPYFISGRGYFIPVLDTANWGIHEAGHVLFRPFGVMIEALGGTIGQLLAPAAILAGFWFKHRRPTEVAVAAWWFAQNLMYVAQYVGDARSQRLPITGEHDWVFILGRLGWLNADTFLAGLASLIALGIVGTAFVWAGRIAWMEDDYPKNVSAPR